MGLNKMALRKAGYAIVFSLAIILFFILIYEGTDTADQATTHDVQDLWGMYGMAIKDAEIASLEEVYRNLTPIIESNSNLIWEKLDSDQTRVMVVTWTGDFSVSYTHLTLPTKRIV